MSDRQPLIYWDADVLTSYVEDHPDRAPIIDLLLADARSSMIELVTSVISIAEVAYAGSVRLDGSVSPEIDRKIDGLWLPGSPVRVVEVYPFIASRARTLIRESVGRGWTGLRAHDAVHLATAQHLKVDEVHTYEPKWVKYSELIGIPISEPRTGDPRIT
jgi:predicted nucleic acid-binding protein